MEDLKRQLIKFWNSNSSYYDILGEEESIYSPNRLKAFKFIPFGSSALDLACGNMANKLAVDKTRSYYGIDISLSALSRSCCNSQSKLICGDAHSIPFKDDSFDVVLCTYSLEHFTDPRSVLREICRVVHKGGRIILLGPNWNLPFTFPRSVQKKASKWKWRLRFTLIRLIGQIKGWLFGDLPFYMIEQPEVFEAEFQNDSDAVYVIWGFEIRKYLQRLECICIHSEVDNKLLGRNPLVRLLKRLLYLLPMYRFSGSTILAVFQKKR